jgi:spectinomycin phosphotransferase
VRDKPAGLREDDLRLALAEGWRIDAAALRYAPVGGGSYHWVVRDGAGPRWFVTADDLDDKAWLGHARPAVMAGLRSAMETALALRRDAGLDFVVAPVPGVDGGAVRPVGAGHAVAVFPFVRGTPGRFGEALPAGERAALTDMLAALHRTTLHRSALDRSALDCSALAGAPAAAIGLARRADLNAALLDLGQPWWAGPFGEHARTLLADAGDRIRGLLEVFDRRAAAVRADDFVITHGEPHPGNVMRVGTRRMLIDWDTVGLGPPERDLWMVVGESGAEARRYASLTGRTVDLGLLEWYRLRWALDDIAAFVHQLRSAHGRTADAEHAWVALKQTVASLGGDAGARMINC